MGNKEIYLKIGEAADYCGLSTQTLRNYDRKGILIPDIVRDSGHRLYSISQLDNYIESKMKV